MQWSCLESKDCVVCGVVGVGVDVLPPLLL